MLRKVICERTVNLVLLKKKYDKSPSKQTNNASNRQVGSTFNPSIQWAEAKRPLCIENSLVYIVRFVSKKPNKPKSKQIISHFGNLFTVEKLST